MKFLSRRFFSCTALAAFLVIAVSALARDARPALAPSVDSTASLRRLDEPSSSSDAAPADKSDSDDDSESKPVRHHRHHNSGSDRVTVLADNHILANEHVAGGAVAVIGKLTVDGDVSDDAVAVMGDNTVNGGVQGNVVAVLGDLTLGPGARVGGDVVCVGGALHRDPSALVGGNVVVKSIGLSHGFGHRFVPLHEIIFGGPYSRWVWLANMLILALYALVALIFPKGIRRCGDTLIERPGASILTAFLAILFLPILFVLLLVTIIGIPVAILLLPVCVVVLMMFGKASFYALIGRLISRDRLHPSAAVFVGGLICLVFFVIPFVGLALSLLLSLLMMGCGIVAIFSSMKKPAPAPQAPPAPGAVPAAPVTVPAAAEPPPIAPAAPPLLQTPESPAASLPRAGFWIRTGGLAIDGLLVAIIVCPFMAHLYLPALAAYAAFMWKFRGATIGGIVCGLKVVRLDDRPLDWSTAIVRALACFLSLFVLCVGFIWVAFDRQRQSWHDKIAGTVVVRPAQHISLV